MRSGKNPNPPPEKPLTPSTYLTPPTLVSRRVPFEQGAVREAAAALRAAEGLLGLLVAVPDVLLQRAVALVAARAVRAGEQLREQIGRSP